MREPAAGEVWIKPSFPVPTVVTIVWVNNGEVAVKLGPRPTGRIKVLDLDLFLGQGFRPEEPEAAEVGPPPVAEDLEAWYDNEVAPLLRAVGAACIARKVPFIGAVGYADTVGITFWSPAELAGWTALRVIASKFVTVGGGFNVDGFIFGLMEHARYAGHSSLILKQLGVPEAPEVAS